jgi:hypothetical protein
MTSTEEFAERAEAELRATSTLSSETCRSWGDVDREGRTAFAPAMAFICGEQPHNDVTGGPVARPTDRTAASRLMLLKLKVNTTDPRWSSEALGRYVRSVLAVPGGSLADIFVPLLPLLWGIARQSFRVHRAFSKGPHGVLLYGAPD